MASRCGTSVKSTTKATVQHLNQINPCKRLCPTLATPAHPASNSSAPSLLLLLPRLCVSFCCCCCCWLVLAWLGWACLKWQLVKFTQGSSTAHAYTIRQDTRGELCEAEAAGAQGGGGGGWGRELAQLRKQQIKKQFDALSSSTKVGASLRSLPSLPPLSLYRSLSLERGTCC